MPSWTSGAGQVLLGQDLFARAGTGFRIAVGATISRRCCRRGLTIGLGGMMNECAGMTRPRNNPAIAEEVSWRAPKARPGEKGLVVV